MSRIPRIVWIASQGPGPALRDALLDQGYTLLQVEPGPHAEQACAGLHPDALLLVLEDGEIDGAVAAVTALRRADAAALLVLAPRPAPLHEVALLEAGADAVGPRDGSSLVLLARLRQLLRRRHRDATGGPARTAPFGPLEVDARRCSVRVNGRPLELGSSAVALMHELAQCGGAPAPRAQLSRHLGPAALGPSRTLDMAICRLRHALRVQGVGELAIESVRGYGYRLVTRAARGSAG